MNAPVTLPAAKAIATIEEFEEMCRDYAGWWLDGILEKSVAVDCVQRHAELWGVVDDLGQDECQSRMAQAFMPAPEIPSDYALQKVREWELDDPRDRWRWTGEPRPARRIETKKPAAQSPAASTYDAFRFVLRLGDTTYLAAWLASHPLDAPHLMKLYEAKHVVA